VTSEKVQVSEVGIRIVELDIPSRDVAEFLRAFPDDERELQLVRAVEVGVFCLQRAQSAQDLESVRRQIDSLLRGVEDAVKRIPEETQKSLVAKLGTGEGQVLAPVSRVVGDVGQTLEKRVEETRKLFAEEIDPKNETSTLGKALHALRDLLDPKRTDSVQGLLTSAVDRVTNEGGQLATVVKDTVSEAIEPLRKQVDRLAMEICGKSAAEEVVEQTTLKGEQYEDEVVAELQAWAKHTAAEVHHVGRDNQPGDVLVILDSIGLAGSRMSIIVEAKALTDPRGRTPIARSMDNSMAQRAADAGLYLSRTNAGLAKEIGDWAEGQGERGPWVACTHEHLITAVRFLGAQHRLAQIRAGRPQVDTDLVDRQVARIRTALSHLKNINTAVTGLTTGANDIRKEAELLRDEVNSALVDIEEALRHAAKEAQ